MDAVRMFLIAVAAMSAACAAAAANLPPLTVELKTVK